MEWNNNFSGSVSRPEAPFNLPCNYNNDHVPGMDQMNHSMKMAEAQHHALLHLPSSMDKINVGYGNTNYQEMKKKKRLTNDQLDSLERSFQEEIKLDPERKTKLSKELGLQPRQIAVWFQNRRARWKAKQLDHLYESLKRDFNAISREKRMLQEEVMKLKALMRERGCSKKQVAVAYTEASAEETVDSSSVAVCSSGKTWRANPNRMIEGNFYSVEENYYNSVPMDSTWWAALSSYD